MSASLVGSEMCIRDRPTPASAAWQPIVGLTAAVGSALEAHSKRSLSVSYTHLTLPTICSV
eukprot:14059164-Alexandrium_andersonii.AAC.1